MKMNNINERMLGQLPAPFKSKKTIPSTKAEKGQD